MHIIAHSAAPAAPQTPDSTAHTHNNTFAGHGYALVQPFPPALLSCSILSASFTLSLVGKTPPSTLAPLFLVPLPPTPSPTGRGKLYRSILIVLMSFNRRPRRHTDPVQRLVRKRCGCVCVSVCDGFFSSLPSDSVRKAL